MTDATKDCTTCARIADPTDTLHCQPCVFFTDGRPPTNWVPVGMPQRAPIHPPSAPYTDTQRLDWMLPLVTLLDDPAQVGEARTMALSAALLAGKRGRDAIDYAMEGSP